MSRARECVVTMKLTVRTTARLDALKRDLLDALTTRGVCKFLERRGTDPFAVEWCRTDVFAAARAKKKGGRR